MPSRWKRFKDYISDLINFKQKAKYGADDDIDEDDAPKTRIVGVPEDEKEKKNFQSLYESNKKQGLTTTLHRSQSTVFHAGVIGQGLRSSVFGPILPKVIDY